MDRYDRKDIEAIINRAVQLQQRSGRDISAAGESESLTLEEIKEIAEEAGISADFVREAALEYEGIPVEEPVFIDNGRLHEVEIMGFAKGELDKRTWAELRSVVEYHFDCPGKVSRRPESIEWEARPKGVLKFWAGRKSPKLSVDMKPHRTIIRLKKNLKTLNYLYLPSIASAAGAVFFFFMTVSGGLGRDGEGGVILVSLFAVLSYLFYRGAERFKEKGKGRLKELMQQLQTIISRRHTASLDSTKSFSAVKIPEDKTTDQNTGIKEVPKRERS